MSKRLLLAAGFLAACGFGHLRAAGHLFFIEAQGVVGYSFSAREIVYYSQYDLETMQKSSLGFDYVQRFASATRDIAVLSVQTRLALDVREQVQPEFQLYNAFLKFKARPADFWIGHNRPQFGLASHFDQHAHLLQPLVMNGYGFDRDWGIGLERDTVWGDFGMSLTAGSGMSPRFLGNWLLTGRLAKGILEKENYNFGLSFGFGKTLDVMGNHLLSETAQPFRMAEVDLTWLKNNWENRFEVAIGQKLGTDVWAVLWRLGLGLLDENRLKLELQPALLRENAKNILQFSLGLTFLASADWTLRAMFLRDGRTNDSRLVLQAYFYKGLDF
jgi:hypothetical protein